MMILLIALGLVVLFILCAVAATREKLRRERRFEESMKRRFGGDEGGIHAKTPSNYIHCCGIHISTVKDEEE